LGEKKVEGRKRERGVRGGPKKRRGGVWAKMLEKGGKIETKPEAAGGKRKKKKQRSNREAQEGSSI